MTPPQETPILVGVAQVEQRIDDPAAAREPLELMVQAVGAAAEDAAGGAVLDAVDSVRVIRGAWHYDHAPGTIAERIGRPGAETGLTSLGGNYVQAMVNRSFLDIQAGRRQVIVVTGAECGRTRRRRKKAGVELKWVPPRTLPGTVSEPASKPDFFLGDNQTTRHPAELNCGITRPVQYYALFETALRYKNGETVEAHQRRVSELWEDFSRVAASNPHAWIRRRISAEEIRTPSPANRRISHVYPKLMNANVSVDQGAALILTSVATAKRLGIPRHRWIYPHAATEAWDHFFVSERQNLYSSPAIRLAGARLFELAGVGVDDLDHVDLYSCFPSAVQVAARELGLSLDRRLTTTGGLTFAGGPLNNYVMHAIATTAEVLRREPGSRGLVTANGGLLTKHAMCIYSSEPPSAADGRNPSAADGRNPAVPFRWQNLQAEVDATPKRDAVAHHQGEVTVESYVVMYGPRGPQVGNAACLLDDGRRTWAKVVDVEALEAMSHEEFCGRRGRIHDNGILTF